MIKKNKKNKKKISFLKIGDPIKNEKAHPV
jgi:hypothetical protein